MVYRKTAKPFMIDQDRKRACATPRNSLPQATRGGVVLQCLLQTARRRRAPPAELPDFAAARQRTVQEQLSAPGRDIKNRLVLDAIATVPRHEFVPEPLRKFARYLSPLSRAFRHEESVSLPGPEPCSGLRHALAAAPVAGKDYEVLKVAHPTSAPPGKVEVIEFFWYQDRNSYLLEPSIEAFVKKEGDRIVFKRAAVAVEDWCSAHSVLHYSLVSFGLGEKLMLTVYDEIQKKKNHLLTWDELADFLATQGVDRRKFLLAQGSANEMALIEQGGKLRAITKSIISRPSS
jgi:protein dithiol oxidoreductase (disulfide-forming)